MYHIHVDVMERLILTKGSILHRGINAKNNNTHVPEPLWITLSKEDAEAYGSQVVQFVLERDVALFDPMTTAFQIEYMKALNAKFPGTNFDGVDDRKIRAAIPFGLPDFPTQYAYLRSRKVKLDIDESKWANEHAYACACINNKHRYSDFERDLFTVETLFQLFGDRYDGYISRLRWPSKFHNGMFPREVCIFRPKDKVKIKGEGGKKGSRKPRKGGAPQIDFIYDHVPPGETWNRMAGTWSPSLMETIRKELSTSKQVKYVEPPNTITTILEI
jgi:hypothetical protein